MRLTTAKDRCMSGELELEIPWGCEGCMRRIFEAACLPRSVCPQGMECRTECISGLKKSKATHHQWKYEDIFTEWLYWGMSPFYR